MIRAFIALSRKQLRPIPGPYEWLEKGIRRYGFHGTSFRWASGQAARLLKRENDPALRLIICHLGGGCSLAATIGGKSVDTTMGFTPMDGIAMCTRSGALDPGILLFLMRENPDVDKLEKTLDRESGLQGLSGLPGDTRILVPEASKGNQRAKLAMDVFIHRLQAGIGQMMASLNGRPDAIVFTDAIGEDEPLVRSRACEPFKFIGVEVDPEKNATSPLDSDISLPKSTRARPDRKIAGGLADRPGMQRVDRETAMIDLLATNVAAIRSGSLNTRRAPECASRSSCRKVVLARE